MATKKQLRKRIRRLETKAKALEVENFNLFCSNYILERNKIKVGDEIELELESLPVRRWWQL